MQQHNQPLHRSDASLPPIIPGAHAGTEASVRAQDTPREDLDLRADQGLPLDGSALLLTVEEASAALRISRWTLYQLINKRRLRSVLIGRRRRIAQEDLVAFVTDLRAEGAVDV